MWANIPEGEYQPNAIITTHTQNSPSYVVFGVVPVNADGRKFWDAKAAAVALLESIFSTDASVTTEGEGEAKKLAVRPPQPLAGHKFRPDAVEEWYARPTPGHGIPISDTKWDVHPNLMVELDFRIFVYVPAKVEGAHAKPEARPSKKARARKGSMVPIDPSANGAA